MIRKAKAFTLVELLVVLLVVLGCVALLVAILLPSLSSRSSGIVTPTVIAPNVYKFDTNDRYDSSQYDVSLAAFLNEHPELQVVGSDTSLRYGGLRTYHVYVKEKESK